MKILFDSQIFDAQKYGGVSRYFCELFKYFDNLRDIEYTLPACDTRNEYLLKTPTFMGKVFLRKSLFPRINFKIQRILSRVYDIINPGSNINITIKVLKGQNFDIFHPTYYQTYFLKYLKNKPMVLTVYDMIHELYSKEFSLHNKTIELKKKLIEKADKIIAISENTKKDIMRFYNIPDDKIKVIYLGNSLEPVQSKPADAPEIPEKYILYIGSRVNYKNFTKFIESISPILNKDREIKVIIAGGYSGKNNFSNTEKELFKKLNITNQIFQYSVTDEGLAYLYQNAICFVFPSLYEGFGIPVLEAFACGCPAIISNTSSLPEVGGDAVIYFDPTNSDSILSAVQNVVNNEPLKKEMITKGYEQLKKFSWDKTVRETLEVYRGLL